MAGFDPFPTGWFCPTADTLEAPQPGGPTRQLTGTLLGNTYRAGDRPIRLKSRDTERSLAADPTSPLGFDTNTNRFSLGLRPDGTRLVGEDRWFTYQFENAETLYRAAGDISQADTLKSQSADSRETAPSSDVTPLVTTGTPSSAVRLPSSGSTTSASRLSPSAFPTTAGVYVLSNGLWKPLPGKSVQKARIAAAAAKTVTKVLADLNVWHSPNADRAIDGAQQILQNLTFDDFAPVPTVSAKEVVLVYVGALTSDATASASGRHDIQSYPPLGLAPAKTLPNGARTIPLTEVGPLLVGFGSEAVAGTLEQPTPTTLLWRADAALPAGRYVALAGAHGYELAVE